MATQIIWGTLAKVTGGLSGTAPEMYVGSTDQLLSVIITAGALANLYAAQVVKTGDVFYVNYDQDGTPGQGIFTVTATSGGSLVAYPNAVGGALLAANNLSDVANAATSATNLGLGTASNVQFANVSAGTSGTAGTLKSFPSAATTGSFGLTGVANSGNFAVVLSNASHGQASTYTLADAGVATGSLLNSALAAADPMSNLIYFDVTVTQANLATAGTKTLYASSGSKQYKVRELFVNSGGTNFSGGGGDRLMAVSDGTTVYSVVPAASLQTLVNTRWGVAGLPYPASAAIDTSTVAGQGLRALYSGGTTDYTAGSVVVSGLVQRVA